MSDTVYGKKGDHVLIAPPYIINETEINNLSTLLAESLDEAIESC